MSTDGEIHATARREYYKARGLELPEDKIARLERENADLRVLLARLVNDCTPPRLPRDSRFYGVAAPDKALLEEARAYLARSP